MEKTSEKADSPEPPKFNVLVFLEKVPKYLKEGPWSPIAHLVLMTFLGYILLTFEYAMQSYNELTNVHSIHYMQNVQMKNSNKDWIQYYRLFGGIYGICVTCGVIHFTGVWPLASFTLKSWNLATLRLVTSFVGALNLSISPSFQVVAGKVLAFQYCNVMIFRNEDNSITVHSTENFLF